MSVSNLLKQQIYAGIMEVIKDSSCYYTSYIGYRYDGLTEKGAEELKKFIDMMAPHMLELQNTELKELAKKMVVEELAK